MNFIKYLIVHTVRIISIEIHFSCVSVSIYNRLVQMLGMKYIFDCMHHRHRLLCVQLHVFINL